MVTVGDAGGAGGMRSYDFRHPQRMTSALKEQLAADQSRLAEELGRRLSRLLRTDCRFEFRDAVDGHARAVLEEPGVAAFRVSPSGGTETVLLSMDPALAQLFVDALLGGKAVARKVERAPTEIEVAVLGLPAEGIAEQIAETLPAYVPARGDVVHLPSPGGEELEGLTGVVCSLAATFEDSGGEIHLFFGQGVLDRVTGRTADENNAGDGKAGKPERMAVDAVAGVRLKVKAQFPPEPVRIRDVASLEIGDVLYLDRKLFDEVEVRVGGRLAFFGHVGTVDDSLGVQVCRAR